MMPAVVDRNQFELDCLVEIARRYSTPDVLQLGSRVIYGSENSVRKLFPDARSFRGIDYIAGPGVDIVTDCHRMTEALGLASVDVIWSDATLEHLSHVWLAVAEMARTLRMGGLAVHITHQTFPLHAAPSDYWRFSTDAMASLFCKQAGFKILKAAYCWPISIVHSPGLPATDPCYVHTVVLAQKISEPDPAFDALKEAMR